VQDSLADLLMVPVADGGVSVPSVLDLASWSRGGVSRVPAGCQQGVSSASRRSVRQLETAAGDGAAQVKGDGATRSVRK
jgi:hypothetical protein